ncbi:hypothetical protein [Comamonas jiangduensis]|uniref:Uncharacterized protein n=1 Tax=Comamonas jiangduensis TaxID=1194168 RepID=A0ABV4IGA2_9BURK
MWEIKKENILDLSFKDFQTKEILYEFDGPKVFTLEKSSILFFAYFSDIDYQNEEYRLIICKTDEAEISNLKIGSISLDQILEKEYLWIVDFDFEDIHKKTTLIKDGFKNIPSDKKPKTGTLLWPHLKHQTEKDHSISDPSNSRGNWNFTYHDFFEAFSVHQNQFDRNFYTVTSESISRLKNRELQIDATYRKIEAAISNTSVNQARSHRTIAYAA